MANPIQSIIFDRIQIPRMQTVLDLASSRQKLLTENVANAETPGYRRKDIDFQSELKSAMSGSTAGTVKTTRPEHMGGAEAGHVPKVERENIPEGQEYGVSIDQEMAQVARNQMEFNVAARIVQKKFEALKTAIRSGR